MAERDIEARLVKGVRKLGGSCFKWVSPGRRGVPDRIVLLPHGAIAFVEVKAPDGEVSGLQELTMREIARLGHNVFVLWSEEDVDQFLAKCGEAVDFMRRTTQ